MNDFQKWISSSKGYSGQWITENIKNPLNKAIEKAGDDVMLYNGQIDLSFPSLIIVRENTLRDMGKVQDCRIEMNYESRFSETPNPILGWETHF